MKDTTVHSLLMARTLFEIASELCSVEDRYAASAGSIVLQDAIEMVFYAVLVEKGIDDTKNIESKAFDELVGELKSAGIPVPKSGTLKAMNKQRVLTKHFAQVAEPVTIRNYYDAAQAAMISVTEKALGKPLYQIMMTDFLEKSEAKNFLTHAEELIKQQEFLQALIEIRKAIFIEFEKAYSIYGWRDFVPDSSCDVFEYHLRGGAKAPNWMRNKKWIDENVREPLDYIQIDFDNWRMDLLEWNINTAELANIRRLTPQVFRAKNEEQWYVKRNGAFDEKLATFENCMYCLDRSVAVLMKKQQHSRKSRWTAGSKELAPCTAYIGDNIYLKASTASKILDTFSPDLKYEVKEIVTGFDPHEEFLYILGQPTEAHKMPDPRKWVAGFLRKR